MAGFFMRYTILGPQRLSPTCLWPVSTSVVDGGSLYTEASGDDLRHAVKQPHSVAQVQPSASRCRGLALTTEVLSGQRHLVPHHAVLLVELSCDGFLSTVKYATQL
jgi:hypothetical protein